MPQLLRLQELIFSLAIPLFYSVFDGGHCRDNLDEVVDLDQCLLLKMAGLNNS